MRARWVLAWPRSHQDYLDPDAWNLSCRGSWREPGEPVLTDLGSACGDSWWPHTSTRESGARVPEEPGELQEAMRALGLRADTLDQEG